MRTLEKTLPRFGKDATRALIIAFLSLPVAWLPAGEPVDYEKEIQPIFNASCGGAFCHIDLRTNGVELTTYPTTLESIGDGYGRPIVVPLKSSESPLWEKVANPLPLFGSLMPLGGEPLPQAQIDLIARWIDEGAHQSPFPLLRGDVDQNRDLTINDSIFLLGYLFLGGRPPPCRPVADVDGDIEVNITDAVYLLAHLFLGGPPPPALTAADLAACSPSP